MPFTDMLAQTGGLQAMARELGVSEAQAASGAAALLLAVLLSHAPSSRCSAA